MTGLLLDTHVVTALAGLNTHAIHPNAIARIESAEDVMISPITMIELTMHCQKGRWEPTADAVFSHLAKGIGLRIDDISFAGVCLTASQVDWTMEPFDRLISAHALYTDTPLLTADRMIRANLDLAVWDEEETP